MGRPTDEEVKAKVLKYATNRPGSCRAVTETMKADLSWGGFEKPVKKGSYRTYINRGYADEHWAYWAQWADEEPTVIDATIGQFGGEALIFIGTQASWFARISQLCGGATVVIDAGGRLFNAANLRDQLAAEAEAEYYADIDQQWTASRKPILASCELHMSKTLRK